MPVASLAQECSNHIHDHFQDYEHRFRQITQAAPQRFQSRQWSEVQSDTTARLNLYEAIISRAESAIHSLLADRIAEERIWEAAKQAYTRRIATRYDRELAETFFNSVTRRIFGTVGVNQHIEFVNDERQPSMSSSVRPIYRTYLLSDDSAAVIRKVFADYTDLHVDQAALDTVLPLIAAKIEAQTNPNNTHDQLPRIEMLRNIFYRGQGAFLVGRIIDGEQIIPMVMALLHRQDRVVVDALLLDADGVSILFSYTRSAFHVLVDRLKALIGFLKTIMPAKPVAEIYSAIGYFKHGKTVLYQDICQHTAECTDDRFNIAPGQRGMVMIVFNMDGYEMVVKLIRDHFGTPKKTTRTKVMEQYDFVFKHYRVGRLIEAHAFEHLSFDRCMFADDLIEHLIAEAGQTVRLDNDRVIIDHAYLERRVTPLDIYLKEEDSAIAEAVVVDLGNAIKDLAFANIFPGDTLLKNFGVTRHGRVVFYDYDEILPLTACRFRKIPKPRTYMEEMADEPWYMIEEDDVFPEEFSRFMGLSPRHRQVFLQHHEDLLTPDFWVMAQEQIRSGHTRHVRPYLDKYRLNH